MKKNYIECPRCERVHTITNQKETICICGAELEVIKDNRKVELKEKAKPKFKHRRIS